MTQPIAGTYSTLVTLGSLSGNPTTITATGLLSDGLLVSYTDLTVVNAGRITAAGITFTAGGSVTNQSGGTISGSYAIYATTDVVTVVNAGSITGSNFGVDLLAGGSVTNQSGGSISGGNGIVVHNDAGTVVNAGSITGSSAGVFFLAGGSVTNQSGGSISGGGFYGIFVQSDAGTVVNAGSVTGASKGVDLGGGGSVTNQSGGSISGYNGIAGSDPLTVVNAGSITGANFGVDLLAGGSVTNQSGGSISGGDGIVGAGAAVTVVNAGTITVANVGVVLIAGGSVTNQGGDSISGQDGIVAENDAGTVVNAGSVTGSSKGVDLGAGGSVTNQSGGSISGQGGIVGSDPLTVLNAGSIAGSVFGVYLDAGGSVTNQSGGSISGGIGIGVQNDAGTVVNAGTITGATLGVALAGGSVTNQSGGVISGNYGIFGNGGAVTVVNAGTITGSSYAVKFAAESANRLIADPGAVFAGNVEGGGGVLELASAASAGTLSGFGAATNDITNFSTLQFDAGAAWTVSGNDSASGLGTIAITGFTFGDTIDLTGFVAVSETVTGDTLVLTDDGGAHETLAIQGTFQTGGFGLSVDGSGTGTVITVICFAAGTQIGTPTGEVPVEKLQIGDLVLTAHNGPRPVTWIGKGKVLATRGRRSAATPVIVRKGALAANVPNRDLHVTKAHSLYIDDVLIPVEFLVNHRTILWDDRAQEVEIYHVELDSHDVLLANGAPAESYRDDGNRWLFQNANSGWHLPPQAPYAPVLPGGPVVDAVWRRLLDRAGPRALPPLTEDPDLHLVIDGARVDPDYRRGSLYGFRLPSTPKSVVIASRAAVPSELGIARDPRPLGVALRQAAVRQGGKFMLFDAADDRLTVGFHAYEADCHLRWTDGYAELPAEAFARFDKGAEVMLHLGGATQYPDERASPVRAAA